MKHLTNREVLQYTKYYNTIYSFSIINGIQEESKKIEFNKNLNN